MNSNQRTYENDQVQVDFARGQERMVEYLVDHKRYASIGYIGGYYECGEVKIGAHRLEGLQKILKRRMVKYRFACLDKIVHTNFFSELKYFYEPGEKFY